MPSDDQPPDLSDPESIFNCQKCGTCCHGYGGTYVTDKQIKVISDYIGMDPDKLVQEKCQMSGGKPLLAQCEDGTCIFWDALCTIYPVRPDMCRRWPFIESVLVDTDNWHIMAGICPGIHTGLNRMNGA